MKSPKLNVFVTICQIFCPLVHNMLDVATCRTLSCLQTRCSPIARCPIVSAHAPRDSALWTKLPDSPSRHAICRFDLLLRCVRFDGAGSRRHIKVQSFVGPTSVPKSADDLFHICRVCGRLRKSGQHVQQIRPVAEVSSLRRIWCLALTRNARRCHNPQRWEACTDCTFTWAVYWLQLVAF